MSPDQPQPPHPGYIAEIATLRSSMRDDINQLRTDIAALAAEFRATTATLNPRIAVIERRVDDHQGDIAELRAAASRVGDLERANASMERDIAALTTQVRDTARNRSTLIITLFVGVAVCVLAAVLTLITR